MTGLLPSQTLLTQLQSPQNAQGQQITQQYATSTIIAMIHYYSGLYGADEKLMENVISCETGGTFDPSIQSLSVKDGVREDSWGLAQWNLPSKNTKKDGSIITKEDALNPLIALDLMAWYFSQGKQDLWSCTKILGYTKPTK